MKFLNLFIILISSLPLLYWVYLDGAQDILEPFHLLYSRYSKLHSLWPKNAAPNTVSSILETPTEDDGTFCPLTFSPIHLYLWRGSILHECVHGLCSLRLLISSRFLNYIFELSNLYIASEYRLAKHGIDIWLSKLGAHLIDLRNGYSFYNQPFSKSTNFIETKVSAINCRVLTLI